MNVGPILGILAIPRPGHNPLPVGQHESFAEILAIAEKMRVTAFVFSPFEIDRAKNAVWGYHYDCSGKHWKRHLYPLPTVVYNRIPNRTMEKRADIAEALTSLKKLYGPRLFNPCFLDKWKTHTILSGNPKTRPFLPDTRNLSNPRVIRDMLSRYRAVYLKPNANSLGHDIIRVCLTAQGYHYIHQAFNGKRREGLAADCRRLLDRLPATGHSGDYLVQQSVPLAQCRQSPFDLRLLMQKDGNGRWQKTGLAARVAGSNSITTHVFYGGIRYPALKALQEAARTHGFNLNKVREELKELAQVVPAIIETGYRQSFGELEMDIGVDKKGRLWFFEANSKPFRFDEKLIRAKSLVRLIHYVYYLDNTPSPGTSQHQRRCQCETCIPL